MKNTMKCIALILAILMAFSCAAFAQEVMGGWQITENAAVTPEAKAALDATLQGFAGSAIEPVALLATQIVAGTNYCLLCRVVPLVPDAVPHYAYVYLYQRPDGSAEITSIDNVDIGQNAYAAFTETGDAPMALPLPDRTYLLTCFVEGMEMETSMTLRQHLNGDTEVDIVLDLGEGVQHWQMLVPSDAVKWSENECALAYSDCIYTITPYSAQGAEDTETIYTDGTGTITAKANGHYVWMDDQDHAGDGLDFVADNTVYTIDAYQDTVSQRAIMSLTAAQSVGDEAQPRQMTAEITWGTSAFETMKWEMTFEAPPVFSTDETVELPYSDCTCVKLTYSEDGEAMETVYENGTGKFIAWCDENGDMCYTWISDNDTFDENCVFCPMYIG